MAQKSRRFAQKDVVLAKVAGSPLWPGYIKECDTSEDDESSEFNGLYFRDPDWYWVVFFEEDGASEIGAWVRSSKLKVYEYKMLPIENKPDLVNAHEAADVFIENEMPEKVEEYKAVRAEDKEPNGRMANCAEDDDVDGDEDADDGEKTVGDDKAGKSPCNPDPGSTNKDLDEEVADVTSSKKSAPPRRSGRDRKKPPSMEDNSVTANDPRNESGNKRKRPRGNAPAQKRPRRQTLINTSRFKEDGDADLSKSELLQALWAEREKTHQLEADMAQIRQIVSGRRK